MGWFSSSKKEEVKEEEKFTGHPGCLSESQETCFQELKQHIEYENITTDARFTDHYLLRFCRARQFKIDDVKIMFADFIQWRNLNEVDTCFIHYDLSNIAEMRQKYKQAYHGTDRGGRPLYIDCPTTAFPLEEILQITTKEELTKSYIRDYEYLLHVRFPACSNAAGEDIYTSTSVIDMKGLTMSMFGSKSREFVKLPIGISSLNYPEVMHCCLIINAPFVFKAVWSVIKTFIAEDTKKKVKILGTKFHNELFEFIHPDHFPESMGGDCSCEEFGGDCFSSNKGPWNDHLGDKYGELAKRQLKGDTSTNPVPDATAASPSLVPAPQVRSKLSKL
jgi:hypothetical protein